MLHEDEADDRARFEDAHPPLTLELTDDEGASVEIPEHRLPRLLYWHVLLRPWTMPKATKGGILLPDQVSEANDFHVPAFQILRIGPLAFTHPRLRGGARYGRRETLLGEKTNSEVWEEYEGKQLAAEQRLPIGGDWVLIKKHSGVSYQLLGVTLRICNDDDIIGVLDGPTGWKAYV